MKILISLLILTIPILSSCVKDGITSNSTNTQNNAPPTGTVMFHLHTYIGDQEVDLYNIDYTTLEGRGMSLSMAQMYISEIELVKLDGTAYQIPLKRFLKVFEAESYLAGNVPIGNYKTIRFKIGLDPTTNGLDPKTSADSVILNKPEMWFSQTAQPDGYIFANIQGKIDTTTDMTGTKIPFSYKIGTNVNYLDVIMPDKPYIISKDQIFYQHIYIDYSKLFTGVQLNQLSNLSVNTPSENVNPIVTTLKNNIPTMFVYEN
jgi:hypothetical protein